MLIQKASELPAKGAGPSEEAVFNLDSGELVVRATSPISTVEEALAKGKVDPALWEAERFLVNSWEMGARGPDGKILVTPLWQVKVWLKRRAPQYIQEGIKILLDTWSSPKLSAVRPRKGNTLVEFSLYDAHFGSVALNSVGEDLDDARESFVDSVKRLAQNLQLYKVSQIVLPLGNDFFHMDSWKGETAKGTRLECVEQRFPQIFSCGWSAVDEVLLYLREIAPVQVLWVPGNHDASTSFYLVELLRARYEKDRRVSFDVADNTRKYYSFGTNLFGYTHGDKVSLKELPLIMAAEMPYEWGRSQYRSWRTGYTHKSRQLSFFVGENIKGVRVDVMPSLCKTNLWHHDFGFVGGIPSAEMWVWDRDTGYKAHFSEPI